jgi:signal transduction histidine kinase
MYVETPSAAGADHIDGRSLWKRLFLTFSLLGLLNTSAAFLLFYYSSTHLLEERVGNQMSSVRDLTAQKLVFYLRSLKQQTSTTDPSKFSPDIQQSLEALFLLKDSKVETLFGSRHSFNPEFAKLPTDIFETYSANQLLLKRQSASGTLVWVFNTNGLNEVLFQREGLGKTGEIYLVGEDRRIKSASRFLQRPEQTSVENESVWRGEKNKVGVHVVKDYRGVEVVSSYSHFEFDGLHYILLSEIDKSEVLSPLNRIFPQAFLFSVGLLLISVAASLLSSRKVLGIIDRMTSQIHQFNFNLIKAQEEERRRISVNLHDGIGQSLTALRWGLSQVADDPEKTNELIALCDDSIAEVRNVSNDLMPSSLRELGCFSAIREYLGKQQAFFNIPISYWHSQPLEAMKFRDGLDVNIFRMVQELVLNTFKHAKASSMTLILLKQDDSFVLRFEDNGIGMADDLPMPKTLKYRTEVMGGQLTREYDQKALVFQVRVPLKRIFV